jgi:hypothetical protein
VYRYPAHRLSVESEIAIPELPEDLAPADATASSPAVEVSLGPVPGTLTDPEAQSFLIDASPGKYLLRVPGVARYLVSGGRSIRIDPVPGTDLDSVRFFLLEAAFGALLQQRNLMPLHASAVDTPRGAVLFAGPSSVGKSSLAAALLGRGYPIIADEICAVTQNEAKILALPALPRLLLWRDVIDELGLWASGVRKARLNLDKYHVPVPSAGFATRSSPIHTVYLLELTNSPHCAVLPLSGVASVKALTSAGFRRSLLLEDQAVQGFIRATAAIASGARVCRLVRPDKGGSLKEITDLVEEDLRR